MKILLTRISKGSVSVDKRVIAEIDKGLALFVGIGKEDDLKTIDEMAKRVVNFRVFENESGKLDFSVKDKGYGILCISNFTLYTRTRDGRRPSFDDCMNPKRAEELFAVFIDKLKSYGLTVAGGAFGKHMDVNLDLDGPVNIIL
jgi:D-aminoacyl-tRNA deacylase